MSLILEALKKSEAERRAGEVPVLLGERTWVPKRQRPMWPVFVLFVAVVGIAALVANRSILWPERFPVAAEPDPSNLGANPEGAVALVPEPEPAVASMARKPVALTDTSAPPVSPPTMPPPAPPPTGPAVEPVVVAPDPAAPSMMPPPIPVPEPEPAQAAASDPPATFQTPPVQHDRQPTDPPIESNPVASAPPIDTPEIAARDSAATQAPATPPAAEPTLLLFAELPYATRQAMPAMKISMQVYHQDPSRRFIIVNGARLQEGGVIGTELRLSDIRPDGIVLEFRGERFLILRAGG